MKILVGHGPASPSRIPKPIVTKQTTSGFQCGHTYRIRLQWMVSVEPAGFSRLRHGSFIGGSAELEQ